MHVQQKILPGMDAVFFNVSKVIHFAMEALLMQCSPIICVLVYSSRNSGLRQCKNQNSNLVFKNLCSAVQPMRLRVTSTTPAMPAGKLASSEEQERGARICLICHVRLIQHSMTNTGSIAHSHKLWTVHVDIVWATDDPKLSWIAYLPALKHNIFNSKSFLMSVEVHLCGCCANLFCAVWFAAAFATWSVLIYVWWEP